jgi:hypothetical protein
MFKNKIIIILVSIVGLIALTFASLLAYLSYQVRDVRKPLLTFLKSNIDGDLQIGNASVVVFPTGINLEDVKLFAPGEKVPSATVKKAELRFKLLPLIQKKIETRVTVLDPDIRFNRTKDGKSNMERIFTPLVLGQKTTQVNPVDQFWWKRLTVNKLKIERAHFVATQEGRPEVTELKNLSVEADEIRFESARVPAKIKIAYDLPTISRKPMELQMKLIFEDAMQALRLTEGKFHWGAASMNFGGEALLPSERRKDVALNLDFNSEKIDLKKLSSMLVQPLPASGNLSFKGTITGTAFAPLLTLVADSPSLSAAGKNLSNLHAEFLKRGEAIEIKNMSFGVFDGRVDINGRAITKERTSVQLNAALKSLSLAAASGKSGNPARLSGNLQLSSAQATNPNAYSGAGQVSVGPIPIPPVNMQNKVRVGEVLAAGTGMNRMVNLGMLSSSANLVGTQIPAINAAVRFTLNNVTMNPFSLGNDHFNASGSGSIVEQKSINASGTAILNPSVTAQLFPDPSFRSAVTQGKGALSVPFTLKGPLDNPQFDIDGNYLSNLIARAAASALPRLLMGGLQPGQAIGSALKNTPLGNPKNPLSQILGTAPQQQTTAPTGQTPTQTQTTPRQPTNTQTTTPPPSKPKTLQDLLFGH